LFEKCNCSSKKFDELESDYAKRKSVEDKIRSRVNGLGWKDLHHARSLKGVDYTVNQLLHHLVMKLVPAPNDRRAILESPRVN